jgi:hypothetical protein
MARCYICDSLLGESEIEYEQDHQRWRPCNVCIEASGEKEIRLLNTDEEDGGIFDFTLDEFTETYRALGIDEE